MIMPAGQDIAALFSSISGRYDFLNHFLSLNIDKRWRKKLVQFSTAAPNAKVLDICTGTGDIIIEFAKTNDSTKCFGVDFSEKMLEVAKNKIQRSQLSNHIELKKADALDLPFESDSFDIAFMGFGLRNITDTAKAIQEAVRVLKKGGKFFILEFSPKQIGPTGWLYKNYLKFIIPILGGFISGDKKAYRHLATSIPDFLEPEKLSQLMQAQGCTNIKTTPLTSGIAYIYEGTK